MSNWTSVTEGAASYNLSAEHLRYLARTGRVEAERIGHTWAIDEQSLVAYLATDRKPGRKPTTESAVAPVGSLRPILERLRSYRWELVGDGVFEERWQQTKAGRWLACTAWSAGRRC